MRFLGLYTAAILGATTTLALEREDIITGIYGSGKERPEIKVIDANDKTKWSWNGPRTDQSDIPPSLQKCLDEGGSATEMKLVSGGKQIAALWADAALIINYSPDDPGTDKKIVFGVCTLGGLNAAHTVEMLPADKLAIATTGESQEDGFWVFDTSVGLVDNPQPIQKVKKLPATHALLWDKDASVLWAAGMDKAANGEEVAHGLLNAYKYNKDSATPIEEKPSATHTMPSVARCTAEYGTGSGSEYWDGPHDLIPAPEKRKLVISTELDIWVFDIESSKFTRYNETDLEAIKGFVPTDSQRIQKEIPRSEVKSMSLSADGKFMYQQSLWKQWYGDSINYIVDQKQQVIVQPGGTIYKARWASQVPGWETA